MEKRVQKWKVGVRSGENLKFAQPFERKFKVNTNTYKFIVGPVWVLSRVPSNGVFDVK
jgi:hypothetical protein